MSQREKNDYIKFRSLPKSFMTICGLWYYENSSLIYRIIPYKQIAICCTIALGMLKYIYENHSNLAIVIKCLSLATGYLFVMCFTLNKEDLNNLQKALDPYLEETLKDLKISKFILKNVSIFKYITKVYTAIIIFTSLFYVCIPLFLIFYVNHHHINVTHYPGLYQTSYLWARPAKGLGYQIQYLFEVFGAYTLAVVTISVDTLFMLYIFQIVGRLRIISYNISHSGDDKNVLSASVAHYAKLIKYIALLQKIYGPITLITVVTNAVIICTVLFQLSHATFTFSEKSIIQLLAFSMHLSLKTLQTFLYSWSGSVLIEESEKCQYAVYTSNWYGNKKLMTSIVIVLSQPPLVLTACNFSIINVKVFVMVLNTSLSYFFLLQTVEENNSNSK
ncbi:hypothetical protein G9C98_006002 [Cotesia typhae]|uniref:Odorant receptor n=1 Tax=Cotesia typhae TaxID=2053667 RepID=A0A8J5R9W9_9HYME|nr:hypothetical protein G9C98_006002 [Cotesia typhae]